MNEADDGSDVCPKVLLELNVSIFRFHLFLEFIFGFLSF